MLIFRLKFCKYFNNETFENLIIFLLFPSLRVFSFTSLRVPPFPSFEERSDEAISSLHVLVGVRCSGGIASLTAFARNDVVGVQARNGLTKTLIIVIQRSQINKKKADE